MKKTPVKKTAFWLLKSEPETYSIQDLKKDGKTAWTGVRNFQARNFLREMRLGDEAFIYHSNDGKAVVGLAKVVKTAYPELDEEGREWAQVDIAFSEIFPTPVTLETLKTTPAFKDLMMLRQGRLSVMPVSASEAKNLLQLCRMKK